MRSLCLCSIVACFLSSAVYGETTAVNAALQSISAAELHGHVQALADDTFEGREAGSRGGRAAALYLVKQFQKFGIPGGVGGSYYQPFGNYSNIIALVEGSDPELKKQFIIVGAHYDHVGYGTRRNSYGPIGYIHNGADDNASGVSALLEVAQAFAVSGVRPKRSILFCLWDAEEKGLFGSQHWVNHPTVPLSQVVLAFNTDMIGRLRGKRLRVLGTRTAPGLRKLVALANDDPDLPLVFDWELKENSDHHSFVQKHIPIVMFHTGLHEDYHRPSDDADKIDANGLQQTARFLFRFIERAADEPRIGRFRSQAQQEGPWMAQMLDRALPPLPGRLGLSWDPKQADDGKIVVTQVVKGSPADKGGIRAGDQIVEFAGQTISDDMEFRKAVLSAGNPVAAVVSRPGENEPVSLKLHLKGKPVRLGISWRVDDAEPNALIVNRVIPGSPADVAGIKLNDRIYEAGGEKELSTETFLSLVNGTVGPLDLFVETNGQPRRVSILLAPAVE